MGGVVYRTFPPNRQLFRRWLIGIEFFEILLLFLVVHLLFGVVNHIGKSIFYSYAGDNRSLIGHVFILFGLYSRFTGVFVWETNLLIDAELYAYSLDDTFKLDLETHPHSMDFQFKPASGCLTFYKCGR